MAIDKKVLIELIGKDKTAQAFRGINAGLKSVNAGFAQMRKFASRAALTGGVLVASAMPYQQAMAEAGTLVDRNVVSMQQLGEGVLNLSKATGKGPEDLARGLYQTISAGRDATEAIGFLDQASRAAVVGVASVTEAVDLGTSVLNAYGMSGKETGRVFDIAFKAVQQGKTTIGELGQSMGQVLPFAAQLNVSLEDTFAAVATLTKGGKNTAEAVTQLKGVFAAVIKPSQDALEVAKELGIEFSSQAVKAQGLLPWLQELKEKTEGNTDAQAKLFPNLRGLGAIMDLVGKQSGEFARIQGELSDATGAVAAAFAGMSEDEAVQLQRQLNELRVTGIQLGSAIIPVVVDIVNWFKEWYSENPELVSSLAKLTGAAVLFHQTGLLAISGGVVKLLAQIPTMVTAIQAWTAAQGGLAVAVNATIAPAAIFLAKIVAIGAAAYGIYKAVAWLNEASGLADYLGEKLNTAGQWLGIAPEEMSQADIRKRMLTNAKSPEERQRREQAFAEHDVNMDIASDRYRREGRDLGGKMRAAADAATQGMKAGIEDGLRERDNGQLAAADAVGY